jgi:hypothetical protein
MEIVEYMRHSRWHGRSVPRMLDGDPSVGVSASVADPSSDGHHDGRRYCSCYHQDSMNDKSFGKSK